MFQKIKSIIQIFTALILGLTIFVAVMMAGGHIQPVSVAAQGPQDSDAPPLPVSAETLAALGLSAEDIQAAGVLTYDLEIAKTASVISVTAGNPVVYTIVITNRGPSTIRGLFFKDYLPAEMPNASFLFSASDVISDYAAVPLWFIDQTLAPNGTTTINVSGILTSPYSKAVSNRADVIPFAQGEITSTNNSSQAGVQIAGGSGFSGLIYLPLIRKDPFVPVLLYSDDFSKSSSGWPTGDPGDSCNPQYHSSSGQYRITIKTTSRECWRTPDSIIKKIQPVYGSFQVDAYRNSGSGDVSYGIYINGSGGNYYYLFRVFPTRTCGGSVVNWELHRKPISGTLVVRSGCDTSVINTSPGAVNTLKIQHTRDKKILVYVKDTLLGTYPDSSDLTGGWSTGIYARSAENSNIVVGFDNFQIYTVP